MQLLRSIRYNLHARQFVKFVLVGGMTTAINFLIYGILLLVFDVHYLPAATIAFILATLNSYTFNRKWTFRAGAHRNERLAKFVVVQLIGLGINLAMLAFLVEHVSIGSFRFEDHKLMAQVISNGFVVLSNYTGNKFWTFRGERG